MELVDHPMMVDPEITIVATPADLMVHQEDSTTPEYRMVPLVDQAGRMAPLMDMIQIMAVKTILRIGTRVKNTIFRRHITDLIDLPPVMEEADHHLVEVAQVGVTILTEAIRREMTTPESQGGKKEIP